MTRVDECYWQLGREIAKGERLGKQMFVSEKDIESIAFP
jgi:hypothetical protein